jgi:hypothetical protein
MKKNQTLNEQSIEIDLDEQSNISDSDTDEETFDTEIKTTITCKGVRSIYSEYLENDKLLLKPEYQRELSWSIDKMNTFIDTIFKGWIVPNYVIYKLSDGEKKENKQLNLKHMYECIDGQHRLTSIKMFIEGIKYPNLDVDKYIYIKIGNDRVYYNIDEDKLSIINKSHKYRNIKFRNLTDEERDKFDSYQMSFHIIEPIKNGLDINTKCQIFNRLQNGEKVESYVKLRNINNNPITNYIRSNKILDKLNDVGFIKKIQLNIKKKLKHDESFNIYFLIRAILIIDKKHLEINYLDINIRKYLEGNDGKGTQSVKLCSDLESIIKKVITFVNWFSSYDKIKCKIIPELCYLYLCIYANFSIDEVIKVIDWFDLEQNQKIFKKFNDCIHYKNIPQNEKNIINTSKVTDAKKMKERYNWLLDTVLKKTDNL